MPFAAGTRFGPYEITGSLGSGGMGEVYRARDTRLDRTVAIKVLPDDLAADPEGRARLEREAKTIAGLSHPHICTLFDVGEHDGSTYLVMEHLAGETLADRLQQGPLSLEEALGIAMEIADALSAAHHHGVIHRDLKPANVIVLPDGHVKVLDFGLAKHIGAGLEQASEAATIGVPSDQPTLTQEGVVVGTVSYMSPEQVEGRPLDARSDVFSFGAVLYEVLTGRRAFSGDSPISTLSAILRDTPEHANHVRAGVPRRLRAILDRCLEKRRDLRYASAVELHQDLVACQAQLTAQKRGLRALLRRPRFAIPLAALAVALLVTAAWSVRQSSRVRWARTVALPEINRLLDEGRSCAALRLVARAEAYLPGDPDLQRIRQNSMRRVTFLSDPPGADVYIRDYIETSADAPEDHLGRTPLEAILVPAGHLRYRISKPGLQSVEGYTASAITGAAGEVNVKLDAEGTAPAGMVRVRAQKTVDGFWLDKYEVTNLRFKEFVARGGYQRADDWREPFIKDGATIPWPQAMAEFTDATGRAGPATWQFGTFPQGQEDYPVGGVSWYEAAAFCAFEGKSLPTVRHWQAGALQGMFATILETSNFSGRGPVRVGSSGGLGPYGTYDAAGNVKEWCWNGWGDQRYILGGAWDEPKYMFYQPEARVPFERAAANGFRCAKYEEPVAAELTQPVDLSHAAMQRRQKPVSDEVFETYKAFTAYDRGELDGKVEATNDRSPYWREEKVSYRAAYGNERVTAYLFLPKNADPPFQTVVFFPGIWAFDIRSSARLETQWFDFIIRSGRALLHPIYKGTYERTIGGDSVTYLSKPAVLRELGIDWSKDVARSVDYLETRSDIDRENLAYEGISLGAAQGPRFLVLEPRLKTGVLLWGGIGWGVPEVNSVNFAPRCRTPILMVNGDADMQFPPEGSQIPMFRLLATPEADKKRFVVKGAGHVAFNQDVVREVLGWLDKYLGPVETR